MDFSGPVECGIVELSPDGGYVACGCDFQLNIITVITQESVASFTCIDTIQEVQWSPDSRLLLCATSSSSVVQLWSVADLSWKCRVDCGEEAPVWALWAPDSRSLITVSHLSLRASVWPLCDRSVAYIKYLKPIGDKCLSFSPDGSLLAAIERRASDDYISLFDARSWTLIGHIASDSSLLAGVCWSPDSRRFCVYDGWQRFCVALFDTRSRPLAKLELTDAPLGVASVRWCASGQLLAVTGYDNTVRLVSMAHWTVLSSLSHRPLVQGPRSLRVYRECHTLLQGYKLNLAIAAGSDLVSQVTYLLDGERPVMVELLQRGEPSTDVGSTRTLPVGVSCAIFSADSSFLATRYDGSPQCVWLWSMHNLSLHALLIHRRPVKDMCWSIGGRLALCTGSRHICLWLPTAASTYTSPVDLPITKVQWTDASTMILRGKSFMTFCRLAAEKIDTSSSK